MSQPHTTQFPLRISIPGSVDATDWEALADTLRTELLDAGATSVERVSSAEAPTGARGIVADITGDFELVVTATQATASLIKIVRAVQRWIAARPKRSQPIRLELAGIQFDADTSAGDVITRLESLSSRPAASSGEVGLRHALVIANLRYDDDGLRQLRAPADDARALRRVLGDARIGGFDVQLCLDENESTIPRRIADFFADRDRHDLLLLHYSGHGVKDNRGRLHLTASDTNLRRLAATAIPASFINDEMNESASRRIVLILDCCYSGAFARGAVARGDRAVHLVDQFGGEGRIVLTASNATEYSFEDGELFESDGKPSVFTNALVTGLETGAADLDTDGEITVDELYAYIYQEVRRTQPGQIPMKWSLGVEGTLVVARSVRGAELPASILDDLRSNRYGLRLEAVEELRRLLEGRKPGVPDAARRALEEVRDHDDFIPVRAAAAEALASLETLPVPIAAQTPTDRTRDEFALPLYDSPAVAIPDPQVEDALIATSTAAHGTVDDIPAAQPPPLSPTSTPEMPPAAPVLTPHGPSQHGAGIPSPSAPHTPATALPTDPEAPRIGDAASLVVTATPHQAAHRRTTRRRTLLISAAVALAMAGTAAVIALGVNRHSTYASARRLTPTLTTTAVLTGDSGAVRSVVFSPDGRTLASGGYGGTVQLWDVATDATIATLTGRTSSVEFVTFSPDRKTLASGGNDGTVQLWDVATHATIATLTSHAGTVQSLVFSPDGKILASGGDDKTVRLWDVVTHSNIATLTGHTNIVWSVAFSPDGKIVASGSSDSTIRLWNVATHAAIATLTGHTGWVQSVVFSPDGKILASGNYDGTIRLWNVG